jgi:hypothetical protein
MMTLSQLFTAGQGSPTAPAAFRSVTTASVTELLDRLERLHASPRSHEQRIGCTTDAASVTDCMHRASSGEPQSADCP